MPPLGPPAPRRSTDSGFALLITITLLAFLVLLLVSLASLTRVETQVANNNQLLGQARQNALMALNIAVGQLQKYAGPDQRVTATADLGGATNVNALAAPSDGKRPWVGVWGNGNAASANTGAPLLLNWLVSGNEAASFTATNGAPPYSAVTGVTFASTGAIDTLSVSSDALIDIGTTGATQRWRLLVGANTTGSDVTRYVAAPLVPVTTPANQIPGLSGNTATTIGGYAWWVGDEGVKARANLYNAHLAGSTTDLASSFVIGQRSAIEWVDQAGGSASLGTTRYPGLSSDLARVVQLPQLPLVSSDPTTVTAALKPRFHDLTTFSYSVLSDSAQGGLKKDLTRALAADAPAAAESARGSTAAPGATADYLFPPRTAAAVDAFGVPTWGLLRSYATSQVAAGGTVDPRPPTDTQAGIGLVITHAGVGFDYVCPLAAPPVFPAPLKLQLFPVVVLWNPHTVTLRGRDYTLAVGTRSTLDVPLLKNPSGASSVKTTFRIHRTSFNGAAPADYFRFKLTAPDIPPGQSRVFTLDPASLAGNPAYQAGVTLLTTGLRPTLSTSIDTGASIADAAEASQPFGFAASTGGTEMEAFLTEFDAAANRIASSPPPTASPLWFQTVQKIGQLGSQFPATTWTTLPSATTYPRFAIRLQAGFSAASTSTSNPDTGVQLQWIAHASLRSRIITRDKLDNWSSPTGDTGYSAAYSYRRNAFTQWPTFSTLDERASSGLSLDNTGTPVDATLWEFPSTTTGLLSLGQLQHAPLSALGTYPSYAVGNSLADFRIPRTDTFTNATGSAPSSSDALMNLVGTRYDLSWQLNRALWDRYFFSTVPASLAPSASALPALTQAGIDADKPLPNSRLRYYRKNNQPPALAQLLRDPSDATSDPYNQAAANLLLAGGFNINSASEQAWRALLGGVNQLAYDPQNPATAPSASLIAAFTRFANPTANSTLTNPWQGYRQLTEAQIKQLATNIVLEVKKRGPFLSLADFVNRRLAADDTGLKGALQSAIDATTTGDAANLATTAPFNTNLVSSKPGTGETWDLDSMRNDTANTTAAHRSRSAFSPKFLTQADILTNIGPSLAARSDTFIIRTYGESINPVLAATDPGRITSRAWCEAVVQRMPDYIDSTDAALAALGAATPPSSVNSVNQSYGRRFQIISFRWLTPNDI